MICTSDDEFLHELEFDRAQALWLALLSDGSTVYRDDHRPGSYHHSAWVRLADHLREKQLTIRRLWLRFRSNIYRDILPADADGYFFARSALVEFGEREGNYFLLGYLLGNSLRVQRWAVPELICMEEEDRDPAAAGPFLIRNRVS